MTRVAAALRAAALPGFFVLKVASGLLLLKLSGARLGVTGFALFSQLMLFAALVNMIAVGGAQNGLVRQVAAATTPAARAAMRDAAYVLWLGVILIVGMPVALASPAIADLLLADRSLAVAIVAVAALSLGAGPGQIWCAVLTGRGRPAAAMVAQIVGLLVGTAAAAALLLDGRAVAAALAFAAGPFATAAVAWRAVAAEALPRPSLAQGRAHALALLRYGGAFALLAAFTASTLFLLRGAYQDRFGLEPLGYWLTANRISDTTTQLMALYLLQYFVPAYTVAVTGGADASARRALALRGGAVAAAMMTAFLAAFALAPGLFVHLFLSSAFVPAIPVILAYMTGDVLRVWAVVAMHAAFARGHLVRYVAIEVGTIVLMAAILLPLVAAGRADAPAIAYPAAYGATAALLTLAAVVARVRRRPGPARAGPPS